MIIQKLNSLLAAGGPGERMVSKGQPASVAFWMAIESKENWLQDQSNNFSFEGVTNYHANAAEAVREGDYVFTYIPSPHCSFADIRMITANGHHRSPLARNYSVPCVCGLKTTPVIVLKEKNWVQIRNIVENLSFLKNKKNWGWYMRSSFREISQIDARNIVEAFEAGAAAGGKSSLRDRMGLVGDAIRGDLLGPGRRGQRRS